MTLIWIEKRNCNEVQPLFISVDPARDSIGQLQHYSQDFHKSIMYLTGTKDQVAVAARAFRVYFSKVCEYYILYGFIRNNEFRLMKMN